MAYDSTENIRDEAGFTGNTNVADAKITAYQNAATSHIDGIISRTYTLPLTETPDILKLIERKLAAGHLLLDEYGDQAEGTSKDGQAKVNWAEEMLRAIEGGLIRLLDSDQDVLARSEKVSMKGFPDKTEKDNPHIFKVGQVF